MADQSLAELAAAGQKRLSVGPTHSPQSTAASGVVASDPDAGRPVQVVVTALGERVSIHDVRCPREQIQHMPSCEVSRGSFETSTDAR